MVAEKVQFRHFSWLHKVDRLLRVLVFKDAGTNLDTIIEMLEQGGFTPVSESVDTLDALRDVLTRQEWDAVIACYDTAPADLLNSLRLVRSTEFDLPFIIISNQSEESFIRRILQEGIDGFLPPDQLHRLVPIMDHTLRKLEHHRGFMAKATALEETCKSTIQLVASLLQEMQSSLSAEQQLLEFMMQGRFGDLPQSQLTLLEEIRHAKRQTGQWLDNIFWIFAEQNGKAHPVLERSTLNRILVRDVIPACNHDAAVKRVLFQLNLDPSMPDMPLHSPGIGVVFKNLIQTALNHAQPGDTLCIATHMQASCAVCRIENSHMQLDPNYLATLCTTYSSSGPLRLRSPAALGLYVAQKILDACHGELRLETPPNGQGGALVVMLPIKSA